MKGRILLTLLIILRTEEIFACHPKETAVSNANENQDAVTTAAPSRQKRQVSNAISLGLEEFFVSCMQSYRRFRPIDITTIVSFTIDQTKWFESSDQNFCASDTVQCWRHILYAYMNRYSELFVPALQCIQRYGDYRGRSAQLVPFRYNPHPRGRFKRQSSSLPIGLQTAALQLRRYLPGYRGDFGSLIQFFQDDAICSPNFCDCTGILLPPGEFCGQSWYSKLGAMTRPSSPFRAPLVFAINSIVSAGVTQQQQQQNRLQSRQQLLRIIFALDIIRRSQFTTARPPEISTTNRTTTRINSTLPPATSAIAILTTVPNTTIIVTPQSTTKDTLNPA